MSTSGNIYNRRLSNYFGAFLIAMLLILSVISPFSASKSEAADLNKFQAGNIISDSVFFNGGAMSASEVQAFLDSKVPTCTINNGQPSHAAGAPWGSTTISSRCLKNYTQYTPNMAAQPGKCAAYPGGNTETAAQIIAKIGQICNISQKVLLVLLEKEQSLVTDTWPAVSKFAKATGFACYDNGQPCQQQYAGFFYQVWSAAKQFQTYGTGSFTWYPVGATTNILYQANMEAQCGRKPVYIQNRATAALYYYTPYTPNQAALNAGYGTGDACSAYGNRNFYQLFVDWFGTTNHWSADFGGAWQVLSGSDGKITTTGWLISRSAPNSSASLVFSIDGVNQPPVVANQVNVSSLALFANAGNNHGFSFSFPSTPGRHSICAFPIINSNTRSEWGCTMVTVLPANNFQTTGRDWTTDFGGSYQYLSGANGQINASGWLVEKNWPASNASMLFSINGVNQPLVGVNQTNNSSLATFPNAGTNHGFNFSKTVPLGNYKVCAFPVTKALTQSVWGCRIITVTAPTSSPTPTPTPSVSATPRASSTTAPSPAPTVSATPRATATPTPTRTVAPAPSGGITRISAYPYVSGITTSSASWSTVLGGQWQTLSGLNGQITTTGWLVSKASQTSTPSIAFTIDGVRQTPVTANQFTNSSIAQFPNAGKIHGFAFTIPATVGTHEICGFPVQNSTTQFQWGCTSVTVSAATAPTTQSTARSTAAYPYTTAVTTSSAPWNTTFGGQWQLLSGAGGKIITSGWLISSAAQGTTPSIVFTIDGVRQTAIVSNQSNQTSLATFPSAGKYHGFVLNIPASAGRHEICGFPQIDSARQAQWGCISVTVTP